MRFAVTMRACACGFWEQGHITNIILSRQIKAMIRITMLITIAITEKESSNNSNSVIKITTRTIIVLISSTIATNKENNTHYN